VVSGPAGQPVLLAFAERRLFAVIVLTIGDHLVQDRSHCGPVGACCRPAALISGLTRAAESG
jgi:hypothetical protein